MRCYFTMFLLLLSVAVHGQYGKNIRTGRPGQAIGPFTVGKNVLQLQAGLTYGWLELEGSNIKTNLVDPNAVIRFGILERLEVSAVIGYSSINQESSGEEQNFQGISNAQIGLRYNILNSTGSGPSIGLQSRIRLNTLSGDFDQEKLGNTTILAISQGLGQRFGLTSNLGVTWLGNGGNPFGTYVLNLGVDLSDKVSIFIENYGLWGSGDFDTRFDTGLGYLVNPDLKLDVSAGYGKNDGLQDYFVDLGFSWRTFTKKP